MSMQTVSQTDIDHLAMIRKSVKTFLKKSALAYDNESKKLLDIAPQVHEGAKGWFKKAEIHTLDIDPKSGADFIADLCYNNEAAIPSDSYDIIVCTEVLEHTLQPFDAVAEINRLLKPGGMLLATVPFNLRIHGPLPDCWRFTEHGLRSLLRNYDNVLIEALDCKNRFLMPIHYLITAYKK